MGSQEKWPQGDEAVVEVTKLPDGRKLVKFGKDGQGVDVNRLVRKQIKDQIENSAEAGFKSGSGQSGGTDKNKKPGLSDYYDDLSQRKYPRRQETIKADRREEAAFKEKQQKGQFNEAT